MITVLKFESPLLELSVDDGAKIYCIRCFGVSRVDDCLIQTLEGGVERYGFMEALHAWIFCHSLQLLSISEACKDPESIKYRAAIDLWNNGGLSWPDIAEQLGEPRSESKSFMQNVKRFAKNRYTLREGKPGAKRKSE